MMPTTIKEKPKKEGSQMLKHLVYEEMDGKPIYYKGYKSVLNKTKTLEDIMPCSSLQFVILDYFLGLFYGFIDRNKYLIATNEAGVHVGHRKNHGVDLAIFDWAALTPDKISKKYADVPPVLAIEIDIDAEVSEAENEMSVADYINIKVQRLLDFGVERMIWVFSDSKKVLIAERGKDWLIKDWHQEIELWESHSFNLGAYLKNRGITGA